MKQMMMSSALFIAILLLSGCNILTYEDEQTYALDATDLDTLIINHDQGDVTITGVEGSNEVKVEATFTASGEDIDQVKQFAEEKIDMSLTSEGKTGLLKTAVNYKIEKEQGKLNLKIEVPSRLKLDYRQNEGQLIITSMKTDMNVQHGAKHLTLEDIEGDIKIVDGSGRMLLKNITGNLSINKSTGQMNVSESTGTLEVIAGSANLEIIEQTGDVSIRSGSGNVNVQQVTGDVVILENRSGTLEVSEITGNVTEPKEKENDLK